MQRETFGSLETVDIPALDIRGIVAKVDTGAWSGALHCTNIFEEDGKLHFTPLGDGMRKQIVEEFEMRMVRSAMGHEVKRYLVPFTLEINGKTYHTVLGLSDRTLMMREMLLGRKFLIENNILVDVMRTLDDDHEAEMYL